MQRGLLAASVSVGIAGATPWLIRGEFRAGLAGALVGALIFGGLMGLMQYRVRERLLKLGDVPLEIPVRPTLTMTVAASAQSVIDAAGEALGKFARIGTVETTAAGQAQILADVPRSIRHGCGELLRIRVTGPLGDSVRVQISSRPRSDAATIDLGRNFSHVQRLRNALIEKFGNAAVEVEGIDESN